MKKPGPLKCPNCGHVWNHEFILKDKAVILNGEFSECIGCNEILLCDEVWLMCMVKSIEEERYTEGISSQ